MSSKFDVSRLYREHQHTLVGFACAKGLGREHAKEVVQDAFTRLQNYSSQEEIENEIAFLRTIIVNIIRDQFRRQRKSPSFVEYDEASHEIAAEMPNSETVLSHKQLLALTMADLEELPSLTRSIFIKYRIEGLTYYQIAEKYSITIAIVRRHLRDAIVHLTVKRNQRD